MIRPLRIPVKPIASWKVIYGRMEIRSLASMVWGSRARWAKVVRVILPRMNFGEARLWLLRIWEVGAAVGLARHLLDIWHPAPGLGFWVIDEAQPCG